MRKIFTCAILVLIQCLFGRAYAQVERTDAKQDSLKLHYPAADNRHIDLMRRFNNPFAPRPSNIYTVIEFDASTKRYVVKEMLGDKLYRPVQYLTIDQYQRYLDQQIKRKNWKEFASADIEEVRQQGFIPKVKINSKSFERIFGGTTIDIQPRGEAELTFAGRVNRNENPLFNETQRSQTNFDFNQRIQMDLTANIGTRLKLTTNYNTEAQFDFENRVKLDYTGGEDDIVKKIEAGNVSLPLSSSLITGNQSLFGIKTQLQFGRLNVTSVFSQQKSQKKEIQITNGSQQNEFKLGGDNYEANKHYFLAHYFRDHYNDALKNRPIVTSGVSITKIEVWITNKSNSTIDSRDVLAFIDLGERNPYNTQLVQPGPSPYPAGFLKQDGTPDPAFPQQSNTLLQNLPLGARFTNQNDVVSYFQASGATDNYARLTYARKLNDKEYTLNPRLGYISLNMSLNADEVLAVAYRYTLNGVEYQVGEFSTDVNFDPNKPKVLYTKLLKNETTKTRLPTWDLMMKNVYSLGAYQVSKNNFNLNIFRLDEKSGVETPVYNDVLGGPKGKLWLQLAGLDQLNQQQAREPDGYFDFLENITIDPLNGRVTFPVLEPFGKDLAKQFNPVTEQGLIKKYVYQALYDSTKTTAQQQFPELNRYVIRGTYQSEVSSVFQLNAINIPQGSVRVLAGTLPLQEGADYTVDYQGGRITILNQGLLSSGQPIRITMENNELFGLQQRSLFGTRLDYKASNKLHLGATIMNLTEKPLTQKVTIGEEPISNTIWGVDANYSSPSRFLTKLVDKIPFISTKEPSSITMAGEFAQFIPGHPNVINFAGSKNGVSYIDDFEATRSIIDLKSANTWQISGTPQLFPEAQLTNDLSYGFNRARLAFYNIDPMFYNSTSSTIPANIKNNKKELSNHYVREVIEQEVFPFKQTSTGQPLTLPTLDLAFYPSVRGPYNYTTTGINQDGSLANPRSRWGGMFRRVDNNDFDALNVEYIEGWILDPFIYKPTSAGGDLYINLGNISEDILKDGRKSLENGLPPDGDLTKVDVTVWGRVAKLQPVIQAFDNNPDARKRQDVGLDGLSSADERQFFASFVQQVKGQVNAQAAADIDLDPSSDDFQYFRGPQLDAINAGILKRYEKYNGTEGNSKTSQQTLDELGIENASSTPLPDAEDVNRDNNMNQSDEYFQYKLSLKPQDLVVGQNFISDKIVAQVKLANGTTQSVTWYQFRIPITQFQDKIGNIQDFRSIRFMRMFMTNFSDTSVVRFAKLQLVRGEWRKYNPDNAPDKVIADPNLGNAVGADNSILEVATVNIEENGKRTPIPYVVPPGIDREIDYTNYQGDTRRNEQALSVTVKNLRDGYGRAAFKTASTDFRAYKRMQMFIHAEGDLLKDGDVHGFIRMGADNKDNYYEYDIPLKITRPGTNDPYAIWPVENNIDVELALFQQAKTARNNAFLADGKTKWPINVPFPFTVGNNTITVMGQPDMSKVRVYMLGVRNPLRKGQNDDGQDKSAQVWFNELRLADFDERGGWAAMARINAKLADFGDVTISGSKTTIGFGALDKRLSERNRSDDVFFDLSSNFELGKFFPQRMGIKIPMFFSYSSQVSTPQFDPRSPDIELKSALKVSNKAQRDSILNFAQDYTTRKSINFTNVRKIRTNLLARPHLWDVENFSATYSYTEFLHHDFINENSIQKTYKVALGYNYSAQPNYISPLQKLIKSNKLALLRDFNFSLLPSVLNFRIDFDRFYSENTLRNNDPNNTIPISRTSFNKNFQITRVYGAVWNLTKSLQLGFNATNYSTVDEPYGKIVGLKRDTLWENLKRLGRTTDYGHTLDLNYTVPLNKIPGLDFMNVIAHYSTHFNWNSEPLLTLRDPNINLGNTIQNNRTIQLNPTLTFSTLYNKFGLVRRLNDPNYTNRLNKTLLGLLTSVKSISGTYIKTQGTFLPGYLPKSSFFGQDYDYNAPGFGFLFGSQADIREKALARGWITNDTLQTQLYITTSRVDLNLSGIIEPIKDLRIQLTATKRQSMNYSSNFRYLQSANSFQNLSPVTTGDYTISFISLQTAFGNGDNGAALFRRFMNNRIIISQRLGAQNPNSGGQQPSGFADGYDPSSQDVVVNAFLAAYTGKDASSQKISRFPSIPLPNWYITYNGLTKFDFFNRLFSSFDIKHGYNSLYSVNSFSSLIRYEERNGSSSTRDANNNFLPFYQFSQVAIAENFSPLIGMEARLKNNLTANFEIQKSRVLGLSLSNSQLSQLEQSGLVFGLGYRTTKFRLPFNLFQGTKLNHDVNFKVDIAIRDTKTVIYRADVADAEVSAGAKNITIRPSIDYVLNQRFNMRLFYDSNITKPYTSQTFNTSFSNFGFSLRFTLNN